MLVLALNQGHDGATVAVKDRQLLFSLESEKDSFPRHSPLTPATVLDAVEYLGEIPDVVAFSGAWKDGRLGSPIVGPGYIGSQQFEQRSMNFFGEKVTLFSCTHERSHVMTALGMAPRHDSPFHAALVWEGAIGSLYLIDEKWRVVRDFPVMLFPGSKYAFLFALADPGFPDQGAVVRDDDAGKLMALAAYGDQADVDPGAADTVKRILELEPTSLAPAAKHDFRDSPIYNVGVEDQITKDAAALLSTRIFETFAAAAKEHLPPDIPLYIAGGCGLNCDWNMMWRELGHFSDVFVPPCPNDSGCAIGTAIDALIATTGDPHIDWNVYSGLEFEWDCEPDTRLWRRRALDLAGVAESLEDGRVFAWVQGRAEIGPRALGNRSLLAEPFTSRTRDRLNEIKLREDYRPIAPCCRIEDVGKVFDRDFEDPFMLYFRMARSDRFGAVTHVDGSSRCQTVRRDENKTLHELLSVFGDRCGAGVLCNTSLNFKGMGFINKMSDLAKYCETTGVGQFVVGDAWFERHHPRPR